MDRKSPDQERSTAVFTIVEVSGGVSMVSMAGCSLVTVARKRWGVNLLHRKSVDEHDRQLQRRLDAVDCKVLSPLVPSKRFVNESGIHRQGSDTTELL